MLSTHLVFLCFHFLIHKSKKKVNSDSFFLSTIHLYLSIVIRAIFLVSSHFYWTASHAIGSHSAVSSRTNTPNPYIGQQQQQVQPQQTQQINRKEDFAGIISQ